MAGPEKRLCFFIIQAVASAPPFFDQNNGWAGCIETAARGMAASQNAHSADARPICQCVPPQAGQWFIVSA